MEKWIFIYPFVPISSPFEGENEKKIFGISDNTILYRKEFDMMSKGKCINNS